MTTRQKLLPVSIALVLVLAVGACTRPSDQRDTAAPEQVVSGGAVTTRVGGPTTSGPAGAADPVAAAIAAGDFGTLKRVCGPAAKGQVNKATGSQGVSADSIQIGTFSDPTNEARPGVNQELFDTAEVFTKWCNGLGGIAGRKIELVERDSALFQVAATMADACRSDFYLVGGGSILDDGGVKPRLECLLPQVSGFVVTNEARLADLQVQPQNTAADELQQGVFRYLDAKFPKATGKVGFLAGNLAPLQTTVDQYEVAAAKLGWKTAYDDQYNTVGESTWVPYAQAIQQAGVKGLVYVGEPENLALLMQALTNLRYKLDWVLGSPNMYDAKLTEAGGKALAFENVYIGLGFPPFEYADKVLATAQHLALFAKFKPKGKARTLLAVNAMSAWLLFAEAAKACGAELTRRCVYDNSSKPKAWDAGGLWSAADLTDKVAGSPCFITVKATPTGFTVLPWKPTDGFLNCDPANIVQVSTNLPEPMTLASVGKTIDDVK